MAENTPLTLQEASPKLHAEAEMVERELISIKTLNKMDGRVFSENPCQWVQRVTLCCLSGTARGRLKAAWAQRDHDEKDYMEWLDLVQGQRKSLYRTHSRACEMQGQRLAENLPITGQEMQDFFKGVANTDARFESRMENAPYANELRKRIDRQKAFSKGH